MSIEEANDASQFPSANVDPDGTVGKAAATAHETVDRAAQCVQGAFDRAHECMDQAVEAPRNVIREHPVASVILAVTVGFLWGRLGASRHY